MNGLVYIVDDNEAARDELVELVQSAGYRTQALGSGTEFLDLAFPDEPACVLLDLNMPGPDGFEVQTALQARELPIVVVMISGQGEICHAVRAARAGAVQFLQKPCRRSEVAAAIEEALELAAERQGQLRASSSARGRIARLAPRELEVLSGLLAGLSSKQIAYHMDLSPRTVEIYRGKLMLKLGLRSLPLVIRLASEAGVVPMALPDAPRQSSFAAPRRESVASDLAFATRLPS